MSGPDDQPPVVDQWPGSTSDTGSFEPPITQLDGTESSRIALKIASSGSAMPSQQPSLPPVPPPLFVAEWFHVMPSEVERITSLLTGSPQSQSPSAETTDTFKQVVGRRLATHSHPKH